MLERTAPAGVTDENPNVIMALPIPTVSAEKVAAGLTKPHDRVLASSQSIMGCKRKDLEHLGDFHTGRGPEFALHMAMERPKIGERHGHGERALSWAGTDGSGKPKKRVPKELG